MQMLEPGPPAAMATAEVPVPEPRASEALVELAAIGINYIDVYFRNGTYPAPHLPLTLGQEGAGVVTRVGPGVSNVKPGDRVAYCGVMGSYAEYAIVPADRLVVLPAAVDFRTAAALMLQGMTAHYLSESTFPLAPGQTALVHAGAGGVGLLLTQLAKIKGATVITTVSTAEKAARSKAAGADHVVNYTSEDFVAETKRITGGVGAHVVYDSVGKDTFDRSLDALRPRGYLVLFGASSGPVPPFQLQTLAGKGSLFVTRPTLVNYIAEPAELQRRAGDVFALVAGGELKLTIEHEYPLADAARAHADLEARTTSGKLLLLP